jgi:hypothetical protein
MKPTLNRRQQKEYLKFHGRLFYRCAGRWVNAEEKYLITDEETIQKLEQAFLEEYKST